MPGGIEPSLKVIASWPQPNLINPETRPDTITIFSCVFGPLTVILFLVRMWVRLFHQRNPGWDDWVMLAAMPFTIASTVITAISGAKYFNKHVWDYDTVRNPQGLVPARKMVLAQECIFCVASGLIKISILLFYRRLSSRVVSKTFRSVTWASIAFIASYSIALTIAPIVGCQPISAYWDQVDINKRLKGYKFHCFDEGADVFAASVLSAAQDAVTAIMPTFLYWDLKIPFRQKVALFGIFAIGYGCVALSGLRAWYSWRTFYETYDVTWSTWDILLATILELHVGCFCANAPTLKVFFKHFFHEKLSQYSNSRTPANSSGQPSTGHSGTKSAKSMFSKLSSFLSTSRSTSGYISEPHNSVVDAHGGVKVQKEFAVRYSPSTKTRPKPRQQSVTSTDRIYGQYYEDDIELGPYATEPVSPKTSANHKRISEIRDASALPPMPKSPTVPSPIHSPTRLGSVKSVLRRSATGDELEKTRSLTPMPLPAGSGGKKEGWQSWL